MSKEILPIEYKIITKNDIVLYEGFDLKLAVRAYADVSSFKQLERRSEDEWKVKFYKPENNEFFKPKVFR
jgi:hypothetical protein